MKELKFKYRLDITAFLLRIIFFAICALSFGYIAHHNISGLTLNPLFELSVNETNILYRSFAISSAIFVIVSTSHLIKALNQGLLRCFVLNKEVVLTETSISSPDNFENKNITTIKYSDIFDLHIQTVGRKHFLNIFHSEGKLTIPDYALPNKQSFKQLVNFVSKKVTTSPIKHFNDDLTYELRHTY